MKIAIKANPNRGKEIISLLESLGGSNPQFNGNGEVYTYYIDNNAVIRYDDAPKDYKVYTLEEFEKEFPFKVGDKVTFKKIDTRPYTIESFSVWSDGDIVCKFEETMLHYPLHELKYYKEMKEERNITLTLEKAKEWYKKGGELKEIALQAFTEKELNSLPKSWEEYCMTYGCVCLSARYTKISTKYDALLKLEQLRDCYNNSCNDTNRIAIINNNGNIELYVNPPFNCFLTFKNHLLAREFFSNFKEIIEIAKKLI